MPISIESFADTIWDSILSAQIEDHTSSLFRTRHDRVFKHTHPRLP